MRKRRVIPPTSVIEANVRSLAGRNLSLIDWLNAALAYPGVRLLPLTLEILINSTQLPGTFHKDPADQMIVAKARVSEMPLLTMDEKILACPHVLRLTVAK